MMDDLLKKIKVLQQLTQKEIINNGIEICLIDDCYCSDKIIKAHSIQNKNVLSYIADKTNHVYGITPDKDKVFDKKSVNRASTFKGFCGHHDNKLFEYIDNEIYSVLSQEKANFLYALRAVSRELYAKKNVVAKYENWFKKYDSNEFADLKKKFPILSDQDLDMAFGNNSFFRGLVEGNKIAIKEIEKSFNCLIDAYNKGDFSIIKSKVIKIKDANNLVASTVFAPEFNSKGEVVNKVEELDKPLKSIFLSIVPDNNCSFVIISFLKKDAKGLKKFTNDIMGMKPEETRLYLENLLLTHSENMFFSEDFVNSLDKIKKEKLHSYFLESTIDVNFEEGYSLSKKNTFGLFSKL